MSNKEQLIGEIIKYMEHWDRGDADDRKVLESSSIADLQIILNDSRTKFREQQEEEIIQLRAKSSAAQAMAELSKKEFQETRRPQFEAQQRESEAADRKTFAQAAKKLQFSICDANFSLIRQVCGSGFTIQNIEDQYLRLGVGIELIRATTAELNKWSSEDVEARNQYLKSADPETLRREAQAEAVTNRETAALTAFEAELLAGLRRDAHLPRLPEYWGDKRLDKNFIRQASKDTLRVIFQRHGSSRLTARLHGISKIGNFHYNF